MKKLIIQTTVCLSIPILTGCSNQETSVKQHFNVMNPQHLIPKDSANKMISSYITAMDSTSKKDSTALYSLIFTASELRDYLSNTDIKQVKIMLAHSLEYINNGNNGIPAGYTSGAFTVVIVGADINGNYVLDNGRAVNAAMPCPRACLLEGTASHNLIQ